MFAHSNSCPTDPHAKLRAKVAEKGARSIVSPLADRTNVTSRSGSAIAATPKRVAPMASSAPPFVAFDAAGQPVQFASEQVSFIQQLMRDNQQVFLIPTFIAHS